MAGFNGQHLRRRVPVLIHGEPGVFYFTTLRTPAMANIKTVQIHAAEAMADLEALLQADDQDERLRLINNAKVGFWHAEQELKAMWEEALVSERWPS